MVSSLFISLGVHEKCFINASLKGARFQAATSRKKHTSGAKARANPNDLTARLKSCPSQNLLESKYLRSQQRLKPEPFSAICGKPEGIPRYESRVVFMSLRYFKQPQC